MAVLVVRDPSRVMLIAEYLEAIWKLGSFYADLSSRNAAVKRGLWFQQNVVCLKTIDDRVSEAGLLPIVISPGNRHESFFFDYRRSGERLLVGATHWWRRGISVNGYFHRTRVNCDGVIGSPLHGRRHRTPVLAQKRNRRPCQRLAAKHDFARHVSGRCAGASAGKNKRQNKNPGRMDVTGHLVSSLVVHNPGAYAMLSK
jgi:hypothetical protein